MSHRMFLARIMTVVEQWEAFITYITDNILNIKGLRTQKRVAIEKIVKL